MRWVPIPQVFFAVYGLRTLTERGIEGKIIFWLNFVLVDFFLATALLSHRLQTRQRHEITVLSVRKFGKTSRIHFPDLLNRKPSHVSDHHNPVNKRTFVSADYSRTHVVVLELKVVFFSKHIIALVTLFVSLLLKFSCSQRLFHNE